MAWTDDVRRANETLDWIEARQGPLKPGGYARIETDVRTVRAMAEGQDDARIAEIRARYAGLEKLLEDTTGQWDRSQLLPMVSELAGAAKTIPYLLERLDALTAERDLLRVERDIARRVEQESSAAADAWQAEAVKVRAERDALAAERDRFSDLATRQQTLNGELLAERDAAVARAERAESERDVYRDALTLISRGVWTARNSVESIVWGARKALRDGAALGGGERGVAESRAADVVPGDAGGRGGRAGQAAAAGRCGERGGVMLTRERKIRTGLRPWLRELFTSPYGHWYVRLWGGVMQLWHYGNLTTGITTPGHGERHRWWVRLEAPLSGGRCWWCGLGCYPGPLLGYKTRPVWLTSRLRRLLWRAGVRP